MHHDEDCPEITAVCNPRLLTHLGSGTAGELRRHEVVLMMKGVDPLAPANQHVRCCFTLDPFMQHAAVRTVHRGSRKFQIIVS